jgi:hypothetical protein
MVTCVRLLVAAGLVALLPVSGFAQEATLAGTVSDSSGAVLPGVAISAVHEATGNTIESVTDERGSYRLPARIGSYRLTAQLPGFTIVTRTGIDLLIGQTVTVNLVMSLSSIQETVTVSGEAPLIDITSSRPSGVVTTTQMEEIPVNGRNFLGLVLLAPGSQANAVNNMGVETRNNRGDYQLNLDGQQLTSPILQFSLNPTFSRDAIAEFELLANRFDATQGRSIGVVLNVITKSGTNTPAGSFAGYFRSDRFNAADFLQKRVLPYSNQQISATFGGPIVRNKTHFFLSYEYEREPGVITSNSRYPTFNIDQPFKRVELKALGRVDYEFSPQTRLSVRVSKTDQLPTRAGGGALNHPSATTVRETHAFSTVASLTQILGDSTVNEIRGGYQDSHSAADQLVGDPINQAKYPASVGGNRTPGFLFTGNYTIGGLGAVKLFTGSTYSARDQLTLRVPKGPGSHTIKMGGELLVNWVSAASCNNCNGVFDVRGGPAPANLEQLFPVWDDPRTWNVNALLPLVRSFSWQVGNLEQGLYRPDVAVWFQDDWEITSRLTLNLGVRYDVSHNQFANDTEIPSCFTPGCTDPPFLVGNRPSDKNNVSPRFGFAYAVNDRTVIRGGAGKFYSIASSNVGTQVLQAVNVAEVFIPFDGRADFMTNPLNGPVPTYQQVLNDPGRERAILDHIAVPIYQEPRAYQASVGFQRQIGPVMAFSSDFLIYEARGEGGRGFFNRNVNLQYNPATGANYPIADKSHRNWPNWGPIVQEQYGFETSRRALDLTLEKRLSDRWQLAGTYTLNFTKDYQPPPNVGFPLAVDYGGERTYAVLDQRHRAVFNGIWQVGRGFELSGLYFYGSGQRFATTWGGGDLRQEGFISTDRLRPDGTIVPRNNFVGRPIHRVDLRFTKRVTFWRMRVDGVWEVFNVFNHENYGSYVTAESNSQYGQPTRNVNVAYQPRQMQLGFKLTF